MLDEIHAVNLGLIEEATLRPDQGLTVLTGETGTGKTVMLGALRLVGGATASRDLVGPHGASALAAVRFVGDEGTDDLVVKREITDRRSRAYVDGVPCTARQLMEIAGARIGIVAQNEQHRLATSAGVRSLIDGAFDEAGRDALDQYRERYRALVAVEADLAALGDDQRGLERERDMLRFQASEIDEAGLDADEEEALRTALARLRNAQEISADTAEALTALGDEGADSAVTLSIQAAERIARLDGQVAHIVERLSEAADLLRSAHADLATYASGLDADPAILAAAEQRLADVNALKRKYGETVQEVLSYGADAHERIEELTRLLEGATSLERQRAAISRDVVTAGGLLTQARRDAAEAISVKAVGHLRELGFDDPLLTIDVAPSDPGPDGMDRLTIAFSSDAALAPGPMSQVASGGELSRLVLAITLASGVAGAEVVAFDEIDAGVGGATALALARKLATLAEGRQVLCVTHLPQVAAFASTQYVVTRDGTSTSLRHVDGADRIAEITRMLAGMADSETGREHAAELLTMASSEGR